MSRRQIFAAVSFVVVHLLIIAPFVPLNAVVSVTLGAVSMTAMAIALVFAARWRLVDRIMGGPDKSYAAHRWLGFLALGGAMGHWGLATPIGEGVLPLLADSGEGAGSLAVMGLMIMTAAAMIRAIPYRLWKASHMIMGPIFVLAAFHILIVASPLTVGVVPWTLMAVASGAGLVGWAQTLLRKRAPAQLVTIERARHFDGGVDLTVRSDQPLHGYRPGQFATLAHNQARAEAHPFTIAGGDTHARRFIIRAAGDWTRDLVSSAKPGDQFRLGRGVGRFLPQYKAGRREQLWVAGGVGITPFMATLEQMQLDDEARIVLVYCIRSRESAGVVDDIQAHAARLPQLELHIFSEEDGNRLDADALASITESLSPAAQAWLCGPEALKTMVGSVWTAQGRRGRIHTERFDFRGAYGLDELVYISQPVLERASKLVDQHTLKTAGPRILNTQRRVRQWEAVLRRMLKRISDRVSASD